MPIKFKFDFKKTLQAINYLASKQPGKKIHKLKVIKLLYLADRYHLRAYGRSVSGDNYVAMKWGPVGSGTKDILTPESTFADKDVNLYAKNFIRHESRFVVSSINEVDTDELSNSDIEALNFSLKNFGRFGTFVLAEKITHLYPEWKKHESELKERSRADMSYEDFFLEPDKNAPGLRLLGNKDPFEMNSERKKLIFEEALHSCCMH